jgi:hypothetical protein
MIKFKKLFKHKLNIEFLDNGTILVEAGCCKMAFNSINEFLEALAELLANPEKWEKEYFEYVNKSQGVEPGNVERPRIPPVIQNTEGTGCV